MSASISPVISYDALDPETSLAELQHRLMFVLGAFPADREFAPVSVAEDQPGGV